jgi:asparagine synthase (glutamine-hydrolysing)
VRLKPVYARALCALARSLSPHLAGYFEHLGDGEATRYPYLMCQFTNEEKEALMEPAMRAATAATRGAIVERFERILGASTRRSAMGRLVDLDASTYLVDDINAKVDTASMAHGLEVRCPFLDVDVMNLAARLPGSMLMHLRGKRILRRAMRDLLPRSVLFRPKRGFALPLLRWMRGPLATLVRDTLLDGRARGRGLFKPREVERLISRIGFDRDAPDRVWTLLMLELWFRQFIDHAPPSGR